MSAARVAGLAALAILSCAAMIPPAHPAKPPAPPPPLAPLVKKYCVGCHGGAQPAAGIALDKALAARPDLQLWARVRRNLADAHMPPAGAPHPPAATRAAMLKAIDALIASHGSGLGHVTLRRLNRAEYDDTIRDLLGLDLHLSADFPSDDVGNGFDNMGEVLSTSPLLLEKYLVAAEHAAEAAIIVPEEITIHKDASEFTDTPSSNLEPDGELVIYSDATVVVPVKIPESGDYDVRVLASAQLAGDEPPKMRVEVDGTPLQTVEVKTAKGVVFEFPAKLAMGSRKIGVSFLNDYYNAATKADRNLVVDYVEVVGPFGGGVELPASHTAIIPYEPSQAQIPDASRIFIRNFADRAFRRPATAGELDRLHNVFDVGLKVGGDFDMGMRAVVEAVLISPEFLFRLESDPKAESRPLDDYELASRLSYFLWSSMPDDELRYVAKQGNLRKADVLAREVARMCADPKAAALAENFAAQWLQLRKLAIFQPDRVRFPDMDDAMRADMATETKLFFSHVLAGDRSVLDFLDGRYTFLDERLAKHYGIAGVVGRQFREVQLDDPNRAGVLTQASVLCVTSNPTRTSPTKRGKWVLEALLGTPPPPPPPGVGTIVNEAQGLTQTSLRKLMEAHRANPACAACHAKMDPLGFGLENFDAVGRWRTADGKFPIDASGVLPDGRTFNGPAELREILLSQKDQFVRALAEKLLCYALGRGLVPSDDRAVDEIVRRTVADQYKFSAMIEAIVVSKPFLNQGGDGPKP